MALPVLTDVKTALRIETTAADNEMTAILARATGIVRYFLDRPIEATPKTYTVYADGARAYRCLNRLFIPDFPVKLSSPAPVLTDVDGNVVDAATYRVNGDTGEVRCLAGYEFAAFPYDVSATVGLAVADDYATRIEPVLQAEIIAACAAFFFQKNPAAKSESVGGGVNVSYDDWGESGLPKSVENALRMIRRPM